MAENDVIKMEKKEDTVVKTVANPVYNPSLKYTWDKNAKFELTGEQFGLWLNSVRSKVSSNEAIEYQMAFRSSEVIEDIMAAGVAAGVIVELREQQQPQQPQQQK